jgi:C4-dicarboxylate transporter DctM subunit
MTGNTAYTAESFLRWTLGGADNTTSIAIPMFILAGSVMAVGGISKRLFNVFSLIVGTRTGGLPCAVILTCLFYGAISGSGPATAAAVGSMTIPLLINLGYDKKFSAALVAIAGGLGVIIPPSIPFVLYGMVSNTSVGDLFIAGILPGILVGGLLMFYAVIYCKIKGEDKEKIAENYNALKAKGVLKVFVDSIWAVLAPIIVLGGIYSGIVTPTEAAVISVFYSVIVSVFIYKEVRLKEIPVFLFEAVNSFSPILLIIAMATAFSRALTILGAPYIISTFIIENFPTKVGFLAVIMLAFFILGMFMDTAPGIAVLVPILLPSTVSLGINPVHFGVILIVNLAIGQVTPPFGTNLFVTSRLSETPVLELGKKALPLIAVFIAALIIIAYIPWFSLALIQ